MTNRDGVTIRSVAAYLCSNLHRCSFRSCSTSFISQSFYHIPFGIRSYTRQWIQRTPTASRAPRRSMPCTNARTSGRVTTAKFRSSIQVKPLTSFSSTSQSPQNIGHLVYGRPTRYHPSTLLTSSPDPGQLEDLAKAKLTQNGWYYASSVRRSLVNPNPSISLLTSPPERRPIPHPHRKPPILLPPPHNPPHAHRHKPT
jgi:hypothetical protein